MGLYKSTNKTSLAGILSRYIKSVFYGVNVILITSKPRENSKRVVFFDQDRPGGMWH